MKRKGLLILLILAILSFASCAKDDKEKYQEKGTKVEDVSKKLVAFKTGNDIFLGQTSRAIISGDYLLLCDYSSADKKIHLFDKNKLEYLTSIGDTGQGPGEIANMGNVYVNENSDKLYVTDFGHNCIYSFDIDSMLTEEDYLPVIKYRLKGDFLPVDYVYVFDSLCYGTFVQYTDRKTVKRLTGKWNMKTGEVKLMEYVHPDVKNKQTNIVYSRLHDTLVEGHGCADLLSFFDGNLNLKYNVYGSDWNNGDGSKLNYYPMTIYKDHIITAYSGSSYSDYILPTKLHVFTMDGNYYKTLEVGKRIHYLSSDEGNNRLFISFDDEIQFGYLDLKGILD